MRSRPARVASSLASVSACRAAGSNRSNIVSSALPAAARGPATQAARVLLMHRLLADPEEDRDLLPGPAVRPGVPDLQCLEPVGQLAQRAGRPQPGRGVRPAR